MEFTREIYWNIGSGAGTLVPMYALTLIAFAVFAWGFLQRVKVYRLGQPLDRTNDLGARIAGLIRDVLLQSKVMVVRGPGVAHGLFFWGFFLLFIGTCLIVLQADFTDLFFDIKFLKGTFYLYFSLILDLAGLVAIAMLAGLFVRRYVVRPKGLETGRDDAIMHALLFAILLTGFFIEGARMAVTELGTPLANWSPVGLVFAKAMAGMEDTALKNLHIGLWWLHMVLVVGFIMLIPYTKFRHVMTTSANYLFTDFGPKGNLRTLDLEDDNASAVRIVVRHTLPTNLFRR
jgi:nitrate reductase gamma subunit